ncbi:hypothetical protein GGF31_008526 [Allomyces arbusculus]|nr:hypothetical protein GGF31_008526 [Allomyces arbusculus]
MSSSLLQSLHRTFSRSSSSTNGRDGDSTPAHDGGSTHALDPGSRPSLFHSAIATPVLTATPDPVPRMNLIQYADVARAARDLRSALQLVASSADTLHRILLTLVGCRSSTKELEQHVEGDLLFLIQMLEALERTHARLGDLVLRDLESPLVADLEAINAAAVDVQRQNEDKLKLLARQLKDAESASLRTRRAKHRDLVAYQQSLTVLNNIALEIKRVETLNVVIGDELAERRLPVVLDRLATTSRGAAATYLDLADAVRYLARAIPHAGVAAAINYAAADPALAPSPELAVPLPVPKDSHYMTTASMASPVPPVHAAVAVSAAESPVPSHPSTPLTRPRSAMSSSAVGSRPYGSA